MKYKFETNVTPLAAFIKSKYAAEIEFDARVFTEPSGQKKVIFIFNSDTIDFKNIEQIFITSFANTYNNELQILRNLVRTLIPYTKEV